VDPKIQKVLSDYKGKIDSLKKFPLSVSSYKVEKPWGYEIWFEINQYYAYKLIHMKKGFKSSLQLHNTKYETNYIISGTAQVLLENEDGLMEEFSFGPGDGWSVPLNRKHRVIATSDYTSLEVSTPHLDDVVRFEDDSSRPSGKIDSEHT